MLKPGDVKITATKRTLMSNNGNTVPAYEIHFTIRGEGDYAVKVPAEGYTAQAGIDAVTGVASQIIETLDAFK
jgi:hypothetical protein